MSGIDEKWSDWIEWHGGECPLAKGAIHEVQYRSGEMCKDDLPETSYWANDGDDCDIIAYRYRLDDNKMTPEEEEIKAEEWAGSVPEGVQTTENRSDGSTASYYELPEGCTELQDLISYRNLNAQDGEIFRAIYRKGRASHSDELRDARKVLFYAKAEVERLEKYCIG